MNPLYKILTTLVFVFTVSAAQALEKEPYSQKRFDELQASGAVVLLDVYASWCPTCAKQQAALEAYRTANPAVVFHVLVIDFDDDKEQVRQYRAPRQSTLLLYKDNKQLWFSVAETRTDVIAAAIDKAAKIKPAS